MLRVGATGESEKLRKRKVIVGGIHLSRNEGLIRCLLIYANKIQSGGLWSESVLITLQLVICP